MSTVFFQDRFPAHMQSVHALTAGLIDYAGLFPPAGLGMHEAVANYAEYLSGPDAAMLGRFILPASRLQEFSSEASAYLGQGAAAKPWNLASLIGDDIEADIKRILKFNSDHVKGSGLGHAVIDTVEVKAGDAERIDALRRALPAFYRGFVEVPGADLVAQVGAARFSAKIRTGGIEQKAFPTSNEVVRFLMACEADGVPFKATAGLHHIVCGRYPLTYAADAQSGEMFGFLNVFIAAAFLYHGGSVDDTHAMLRETEPSAFVFSDDALAWHAKRLSVSQIQAARDRFAISFGSCSFTEPVQELKKLLDSQGRIGA